ncbi:MAG: iron-containing alcohol dehydrogenase [Rhodospirillales bacterium]|jgi:alcohol dehydrogenase class IV|tara:strand:+ start:478 stop:1644 length:1167 start_codon:yes stop_codon:yes gene_type:complete
MTTVLSGNWNYPTSIRFGAGRIKELSDSCKSVGMKNPLLITDPGLAALPMVNNAIARNNANGLPTGLFSNVKPNPVSKNVDDGVKAYLAGGHDGVIAWGGGSGVDAAKAVALMVGQTGPIWDFEDVGDNWTRVNADGVAPIVAVPTTSGTGSEVGRASVIANEETHTKKVIFHPTMLPQVVICDPELVTGLPPALTAYTGMDALVHCFEAYCAPGYHPMAEGIALEGMRLVQQWLPAAVKDGSDIEARTHMMSAAAMGATAFQKGLGAVHSLSHPVGSIYDTHHGLTNAVFMPYVMSFNRPAIEGQMDLLARYLNLPGSGFSAVMDWVLELRQTFNIANTPVDLGVEENRLYELSEMAANDPTAGGNPIPVGTNEMKVMYQAAMAGRL